MTAGEMQINGRRFQFCVPQQQLNGPKIRAVFQQVCGKAMA
jgi:hypothetical protein